MKKHLFLILSFACVLFACKPDPVVPTVATAAVTEITENSAKSGGEVIADGGSEVTSRGICWSRSQNPTINDNRTEDGAGVGIFNSDISNLEDSTYYYVRAYAVNSAGIAYGDELSFMTLDIDDDSDDDTVILLPIVTTSDITDITETSAICGGNVTDDGGSVITVRGICWSTSHNPTTNGNHTTDGNGTGSFTSHITGLSASTTYYVRAYATNEAGTSYGEEMSFNTLEEEEVEIELPEVKTVSVTDVDINTAIVTGEVISDGGAEVVERGFIWDVVSDDDSVETPRVEVGSGLGVYIYEFTGLQSNTEYYVLAYAINSVGESKGEHIYFTTMEDEDTFINGYEYVDLGLPSGVKWAAYNVGASSPTESGNYYAWGEIEPKAEYSEANCSTYNVSLGDISGNPDYDAARAEWGATWRIPTKEEMEELRDNCYWEWTTIDDVIGYKITGPNGNSIFMPAGGFLLGTTPYFPQQYGYYWTSFPGTDNDFGAFCLYFGLDSYDVAWYFRHTGLPVRAVSE